MIFALATIATLVIVTAGELLAAAALTLFILEMAKLPMMSDQEWEIQKALKRGE